MGKEVLYSRYDVYFLYKERTHFTVKHTLKHWAWWGCSILLWELVLHVHAAPDQPAALLMIGFSLAAAGIAASLTGLPGGIGRWLGRLLGPLMLLVYYVQLVYSEIFGSYLSVSFVAMGGDAVTEFWNILAAALVKLLPQMLLMLLPLLLQPLLRRRSILADGKLLWQIAAGAAAAALLVPLGMVAGAQQTTASVDHWASRFGLLTAEVLDIRQTLLGSGGGFTIADGGSGRDYSQAEYNVLDELDLDAVQAAAEEAGAQEILELNRYLKALEPTQKHAYTGYFEGCNLIVLCAESFSPYVIDPELTPTLYRLSSEGFVFRNFYCSFPNVTTNGEYGLCMGMMPDFSRMSFQMSVNNYLPFTLGRVCAGEGMTALAYHNNIGTFYHREQTHPNMGYEFRAIGMGLDMQKRSPASDLELMEKTVDDYIGQEPFHAYYMTYSGHAPYDLTQDMVEQNWELTAGLDASEGVRSYYAANLELERALTYLVGRLEEAGIAERTVIVLTGDHIPYGLSDEDYAELAGDAASDPHWKYRNSFICWKGGMEEPIEVDSFGCSQDVLPTLLNLFGFDYDSRLLTGRDLLAPGEHLAILKDGSFLTEGMHYDSITGKAVWSGEEDPQRLTALLQTVDNQFTAAAALLGTNYAEFAYTALGMDTGPEQEHIACFSDIEGTWYQQIVEALYAQGVLNGNSEAKFMGDTPANRSEFPVILARGLAMPAVSVELPYPDLLPGKWYTDGLRICWAAGFLPPQWEEYRPKDQISREDALYILTKAAAYIGIPDSEGWARAAMDEAVRLQTEGGYTGGEDTLSRATATALVWMLQEEMPEQ